MVWFDISPRVIEVYVCAIWLGITYRDPVCNHRQHLLANDKFPRRRSHNDCWDENVKTSCPGTLRFPGQRYGSECARWDDDKGEVEILHTIASVQPGSSVDELAREFSAPGEDYCRVFGGVNGDLPHVVWVWQLYNPVTDRQCVLPYNGRTRIVVL